MLPMFSKKYFRLLTVLLLLATISCNKKFDVPPLGEDPDIPVTLSIKDLKARYRAIGDFQKIQDDQVISGVVIADDKSGNFYKQVIIQDETGGIPVLLDGNSNYSMYPIGRKLFIKLKGLMLGDYGGTIQLGIDTSRSGNGRFLNLEGIPSALYNDFILKGSFNNMVTPKLVSIADFDKTIQDPLQSTLVQLNNMQFGSGDLSKTYGSLSPQAVSAVNFTLRNCLNQSIVLRNSSYASFAKLQVAQGNGALVGVPSIFNGTQQLLIRDTGDVQFAGTRCENRPAQVKSINEVKAFATGDSVIPAGIAIRGIVVSDTLNEAAANYRIQDATAGIQVRFASTGVNPHAGLGDSLFINVSGLSLSLFNGGLQINNAPGATKLGTGTIKPRAATVADIIANARAWESTVVTINNVTITMGSSNSSGVNYTITDATGQLKTFVRSTSRIIMPARATSITGYVSVLQTETQITLRRQSDIVGGTGSNFSAVYDFANVTSSSGTIDPTNPPSVQGLTFTKFVATGVSANSLASGRFSFTGWPTGATDGQDIFTGAIDLNKYYEVTITPAAGTKLDLKKITFTFQRSGTGVRQAAIRSSLDGFTANLPASINPVNANLSVVGNNIFQITDAATTAQDGCTISLGTAFTNIISMVRFRFYGFNAEGSGTFSIDNVRFEGVTR